MLALSAAGSEEKKAMSRVRELGREKQADKLEWGIGQGCPQSPVPKASLSLSLGKCYTLNRILQ